MNFWSFIVQKENNLNEQTDENFMVKHASF